MADDRVQQARRELARRELARRQQQDSGEQPTQEVQQPQQGIMQTLLDAGLFGPLGSKPQREMLGGFVRGVVKAPLQVGSWAGQGLDQLITGKQPEPYNIPLMGGNIEMQPLQNMGQAIGPTAETALMIAGPQLAKGAGKLLNKIFKFDNVANQAKNSKIALDSVRDTLGQAKDLALQDVKDVPAVLDWGGNKSTKIVNAIKNPIYGVEFAEEGGIVNTVGNLDKVKTALRDLLTTKDFVEAGKIEKQQIKQFIGRVGNTILEATKKAGRPELGKALKDYSNFMDNYNLVEPKFVEKYGNALTNKFKEMFRLTAEPTYKEAWKEIGKVSPEINSIIKSRQNRELLKGLLKTAGVGIPTFEAGKKLLTGSW